jgi:hypothetical protein
MCQLVEDAPLGTLSVNRCRGDVGTSRKTRIPASIKTLHPLLNKRAGDVEWYLRVNVEERARVQHWLYLV